VSNLTCEAGGNFAYEYSAQDTVRIGLQGSDAQGKSFGIGSGSKSPAQSKREEMTISTYTGDIIEIWQLPSDLPQGADWETLQGAQKLDQVTCR
jgi:hypothetical protein